MQVELAKTAGFCFGVKRAVDTVYEQVALHPDKEADSEWTGPNGSFPNPNGPWTYRRASSAAMYGAVYDSWHRMRSSGVPAKTRLPPPSPPSGPRSMT